MSLVDLANEVRNTVQEQQRMVEIYKAENEQMHAIVMAARKMVDEGSGWFFRVAVPGEDMEELSKALSEYKGRG
jgi:hypothetical protein